MFHAKHVITKDPDCLDYTSKHWPSLTVPDGRSICLGREKYILKAVETQTELENNYYRLRPQLYIEHLIEILQCIRARKHDSRLLPHLNTIDG